VRCIAGRGDTTGGSRKFPRCFEVPNDARSLGSGSWIDPLRLSPFGLLIFFGGSTGCDTNSVAVPKRRQMHDLFSLMSPRPWWTSTTSPSRTHRILIPALHSYLAFPLPHLYSFYSSRPSPPSLPLAFLSPFLPRFRSLLATRLLLPATLPSFFSSVAPVFSSLPSPISLYSSPAPPRTVSPRRALRCLLAPMGLFSCSRPSSLPLLIFVLFFPLCVFRLLTAWEHRCPKHVGRHLSASSVQFFLPMYVPVYHASPDLRGNRFFY